MNAQQIREFDRIAIEEYGIPGVALMENAGAGTARLLLDATSDASHKPIAIFAGPGNNGGDGYVIARHLHNAGRTVWTFCCSDPTRLKGDALCNYNALAKMPQPIVQLREANALIPWQERLQHCSAIVDALLGTGLSKDVQGWFKTLIDALNEIKNPLKLAVDIPSGLDADTGHQRGTSYVADITTTYAFPKVGLVLPHAQPFVGQMEIVGIGAPDEISELTGHVCWYQEEEELRGQWPTQGTNSHKGSHGHLLVLAGAPGTTGAAAMCSLASLRMGAGLCTLATPRAICTQLEGRVPEIMCRPLSQGSEGTEQLKALWEQKRAVAFGPGIGQGEDAASWCRTLLTQCPLPLVIDADGLNVLVQHLHLLQERNAPTILTPHPGEMGRLTGTSSAEVQRDRVGFAMDFAKSYNVILVLKGARTTIATPEGECWINPSGNPGMGTAGSGDVLTGMIGALLARQHEPALAARTAVFLHGKTGDNVAKTNGYSGLIATDLIRALPATIARWEQV